MARIPQPRPSRRFDGHREIQPVQMSIPLTVGVIVGVTALALCCCIENRVLALFRPFFYAIVELFDAQWLVPTIHACRRWIKDRIFFNDKPPPLERDLEAEAHHKGRKANGGARRRVQQRQGKGPLSARDFAEATMADRRQDSLSGSDLEATRSASPVDVQVAGGSEEVPGLAQRRVAALQPLGRVHASANGQVALAPHAAKGAQEPASQGGAGAMPAAPSNTGATAEPIPSGVGDGMKKGKGKNKGRNRAGTGEQAQTGQIQAVAANANGIDGSREGLAGDIPATWLTFDPHLGVIPLVDQARLRVEAGLLPTPPWPRLRAPSPAQERPFGEVDEEGQKAAGDDWTVQAPRRGGPANGRG